MADLLSDARLAMRTFRRTPAFTTIAILSLALGTGANTAVFTLVDQVLLRALPIANPQQLVQLTNLGQRKGNSVGDGSELSYPMFADLRDHADATNSPLAGVLCEFALALNLGVDSGTERVAGSLVSGTYFTVLGVRAAMGRVLTPDDDRAPRDHPVAVISYGFWQRRFDSDPKIIGRHVTLNGHAFTIVGVLQPGFEGLAVGWPQRVYVPMMMQPAIMPGGKPLEDRRFAWVRVYARLKPDVTPTQAAAQLLPFYRSRLEAEVREPAFARYTPDERTRFAANRLEATPSPRGRSGFRGIVKRPLSVLMALVAGLLLIACANVASLLIARGAGRQREMAIRLALGAGRARLVRLLFVESALLSLSGGVAGVLVAVWTTPALLAFFAGSPNGQAPLLTSPDLRILAFTFGVSAIVGVLCGLGPAIQSTRPAVSPALKADATSVVGGGGSARLRQALVVSQVALSVLLLVGATLFVRTLRQLLTVDLGFRTERLLSFSVDPSPAHDTPQRLKQFSKDLIAEVQRVPGVHDAAFAFVAPIGGGQMSSSLGIEGYPTAGRPTPRAVCNAVSPGFFRALGIPLIAGRDFSARDEHSDPPDPGLRFGGFRVAIASERFAREYFGTTANAIGRHVGFGGEPGSPMPIEIIGVVKEIKYGGVRDELGAQLYFPYLELSEPGSFTTYVRTSRSPDELMEAIRRTAQRVDPGAPIYSMRTLDEQVAQALTSERFMASVSAVLGGLATMLAIVGLYGVTAHAVVRRTHEIGIRMALGAHRADIGRLVIRDVLVMTGLGLAIAIPAAWWLGRYVSNQLYGVQPMDPITIAVAIVGLATVALLGGLWPSLRAMNMTPTIALRGD